MLPNFALVALAKVTVCKQQDYLPQQQSFIAAKHLKRSETSLLNLVSIAETFRTKHPFQQAVCHFYVRTALQGQKQVHHTYSAVHVQSNPYMQ